MHTIELSIKSKGTARLVCISKSGRIFAAQYMLYTYFIHIVLYIYKVLHIYITESLCYISETNMKSKVNYNLIKQKRNEVNEL